MFDLPQFITETTGLAVDLQSNILQSIIILIIAWVVKNFLLKLLLNKIKDAKVLYRWQKTATYIISILTAVLIARIWFVGIESIATILGLASAGVAVAMKDPLMNLAGWSFIVMKKHFEIGDRIQIGEITGDVVDQRLMMFTLMEIGNWVNADQSTGRIIHVPNGRVFTEVLANYSKGFEFIWNELPITVTFESDWEKALEILERITDHYSIHFTKETERHITKAHQKMMIYYSSLSPKVYLSVADSGVVLTIRYLCDVRKRRSSAEKIWKEVLKAFAEHETIDFAYPTTRVYYNLKEGKDGTIPIRLQKVTSVPPHPEEA